MTERSLHLRECLLAFAEFLVPPIILIRFWFSRGADHLQRSFVVLSNGLPMFENAELNDRPPLRDSYGISQLDTLPLPIFDYDSVASWQRVERRANFEVPKHQAFTLFLGAFAVR